MAYRLVLLSLMLMISMSSVTHCHNLPISDATTSTSSTSGTITGLIPPFTIEILGVLRCLSPPPNPPISQPLLPQLNGVNVIFSCDGGRTTIADALTDENGVFKITLKAVKTLLVILSDPSQSGKCAVIARASIASCRVSPPTGLIRAPLGPLHTFQDTLPDGRPHVVHQYHTRPFSSYRPHY